MAKHYRRGDVVTVRWDDADPEKGIIILDETPEGWYRNIQVLVDGDTAYVEEDQIIKKHGNVFKLLGSA